LPPNASGVFAVKKVHPNWPMVWPPLRCAVSSNLAAASRVYHLSSFQSVTRIE
jgi:hypothetical protein